MDGDVMDENVIPSGIKHEKQMRWRACSYWNEQRGAGALQSTIKLRFKARQNRRFEQKTSAMLSFVRLCL